MRQTERKRRRNRGKKKTGMERRCQRQREGDYYLDCSKDVYLRVLLLLTSYRIRHCEEKSQWMQMRKKQGGGGRARWKNVVGRVERGEEEDLKTFKTGQLQFNLLRQKKK